MSEQVGTTTNAPEDGQHLTKTTQERSGEGENSVAVEAGNNYDVEMECAERNEMKYMRLCGTDPFKSSLLTVMVTH